MGCQLMIPNAIALLGQPRTIAMSSKCPTVSPELVEGRVIRTSSWFDGLTTNGFSATLQSYC